MTETVFEVSALTLLFKISSQNFPPKRYVMFLFFLFLCSVLHDFFFPTLQDPCSICDLQLIAFYRFDDALSVAYL